MLIILNIQVGNISNQTIHKGIIIEGNDFFVYFNILQIILLYTTFVYLDKVSIQIDRYINISHFHMLRNLKFASYPFPQQTRLSTFLTNPKLAMPTNIIL